MTVSYIEPANDYVLVKDLQASTTIDGISLPDNVRQQEMVFGTVAFSGPLATKTFAGDVVCYGPYAGKPIVIDGTEFRLLREGQVEAYVRQREESDEREADANRAVDGDEGVPATDTTAADVR